MITFTFCCKGEIIAEIQSFCCFFVTFISTFHVCMKFICVPMLWMLFVKTSCVYWYSIFKCSDTVHTGRLQHRCNLHDVITSCNTELWAGEIRNSRIHLDSTQIRIYSLVSIFVLHGFSFMLSDIIKFILTLTVSNISREIDEKEVKRKKKRGSMSIKF